MKQFLRLKFLLAPVLALLWFGTTAEGQTNFQKFYGGGKNDRAYAIVPVSGGYVMAGPSNSFGNTSWDHHIIKVDHKGSVVWTRTYAGGQSDDPWGMCPTWDGGVALTGSQRSYGAGSSDLFIMKLDSNGFLQWLHTFGGSGVDNGQRIVQTRDSGYAAVGISYSYGVAQGDAYLVRVNKHGELMWARTYGMALVDDGQDLVQLPDGGFIVSGQTKSGGAGLYDVFALRTDAQGQMLWARTYGGPADDYGNSLALIDANKDGVPEAFAIGGWTMSYGAGSRDWMIMKLGMDGALQWTRIYGGPQSDAASDISYTSDGGFILTGNTYSYGLGSISAHKAGLLKLDANGAFQWMKAYGVNGAYEVCVSVQETPDLKGYVAVGWKITGILAILTPEEAGAGFFMVSTDKQGNSGCYEVSAVPVPTEASLEVKDALFLSSTGAVPTKGVPPVGSHSFGQVQICTDGCPVPRFTAGDTCTGSPTLFKGSAVNTPGGVPVTSWDWTFGDGSTGTGQNVQHKYASAGVFKASLITNKDDANCRDTATRWVYVHDIPSPKTIPDTFLCKGDTLALYTSTGLDYRYSWTPTYKLQDPSSSRPKTFTDSSLLYTVRISAGEDCVAWDSVRVQVKEAHTLRLSWSDTCTRVPIEFRDEGASSQAFWEFADGARDTGLSVYHSFDTAGWYSFKVKSLSADGCLKDSMITLHLETGTQASFTYRGLAYSFDFASHAPDAQTWYWDFGDRSTPSSDSAVSHTYVQEGEFNVLHAATNSCNSDTVICRVVVGSGNVKDSCYSLQTGWAQQSGSRKLQLFPNPSRDQVFFVWNAPEVGTGSLQGNSVQGIQLQVLDLSGRSMLILTPGNVPGNASWSGNFSVAQWEPGLYTVRLQDGGQKSLHKLVVIH